MHTVNCPFKYIVSPGLMQLSRGFLGGIIKFWGSLYQKGPTSGKKTTGNKLTNTYYHLCPGFKQFFVGRFNLRILQILLPIVMLMKTHGQRSGVDFTKFGYICRFYTFFVTALCSLWITTSFCLLH